jgi:hypothetical protein
MRYGKYLVQCLAHSKPSTQEAAVSSLWSCCFPPFQSTLLASAQLLTILGAAAGSTFYH